MAGPTAPPEARPRHGFRRVAAVLVATLTLASACGPGSGPPRTDPRPEGPAAAARADAAPTGGVEELARRARGPAISSLAVRGELWVGTEVGEVLSAPDARLLVARSGAVRLQAGDLLLVSDGARRGCRAPDGTVDVGSPWRRPRPVAADPCAWLSPADLARALLPRDPGAGRQGRRLAMLAGGPVLLELESGEGTALRVLRRFLFDAAATRVVAREWIDADGDTALRVEYGMPRGDDEGPSSVTLRYPDTGIRLRLAPSEWRAEPPMTREMFRVPGG